MNYNLQLIELAEEIVEKKYKKILIQLPDGLKPNAEEIVEVIEKAGAEALIYFGSCFGGCDLPLNLKFMNIDLVVQFGHNKFIREIW
jgi:2-(3-amino-3-carboxypropyl)histidine synthase